MRERKLTRDEALEEYLVYQIKLYEFLHMFQINVDLMKHKYAPENALGHKAEDFFATTRVALYGLFSSLMDPQPHALNVFDVWVTLYPGEEARICETWKAIEPHVQLMRDYRNDVSFHANKDLRRYFRTRSAFQDNAAALVPAMQQFWDLAAYLIRNQSEALPNFAKEIEPILRKVIADEDIEQAKAYFIVG
jgi:hypothetical protein